MSIFSNLKGKVLKLIIWGMKGTRMYLTSNLKWSY
nr:MAG TPA: hypothetical protein [Caudoviricetes sp.]